MTDSGTPHPDGGESIAETQPSVDASDPPTEEALQPAVVAVDPDESPASEAEAGGRTISTETEVQQDAEPREGGQKTVSTDAESLLPAAPTTDSEGDGSLSDWADYWEAVSESPHIATGLRRLDESFDPVGIHPGSVVTVTGHGNTLSSFLTGRLSARRDTVYISFAHTGAVIAERLDSIDAIGSHSLFPIEANAIQCPSELQRKLEEVLDSLSAESTVIIDPVNRLEQGDIAEYRTFIRWVKDHARRTGGMVVLHAIQTQEQPPARWVTEMMSDHILTVQQTEEHGVTDHLELTRVDPRLTQQSLSRTFQIDTETITLRRPRNIDP